MDTGTAGAILLDPWAAARLGLKKRELTEKGEGYRYAVASIRGAVFRGTDRANDVLFNINQAMIVDLRILSEVLPNQRVAGIIGLGMLNPLTTRFDFASKMLTLFTYPHPPLRLPGATVLPLRPTSDGRATIHVTLTPDVAADMILDTGSFNTQVPLVTLSALHPTATSYGHPNEQIDGLYLCPDLRLPSLNLGTLRVPDVVVGVLPLASTSLGMDILGGYRLTLDGPNAQLSLEPSVRGVRQVRGWSGLGLKHSGAPWLVQGVRAGSPARLAGVHVGDEIVTINGRSVRGLSPMQLGMLLTGAPGASFRVSLRRGKTPGKIVQVSWIPLDEFSAPRDALYGLIMKRANGAPWVVVSVLPGCPGDRAGLQAGDEITHMSGALVADIPTDRLRMLMSQSPDSMTLSVTRVGRAEPLSVKLSAPPQKIAP